MFESLRGGGDVLAGSLTRSGVGSLDAAACALALALVPFLSVSRYSWSERVRQQQRRNKIGKLTRKFPRMREGDLDAPRVSDDSGGDGSRHDPGAESTGESILTRAGRRSNA